MSERDNRLSGCRTDIISAITVHNSFSSHTRLLVTALVYRGIQESIFPKKASAGYTTDLPPDQFYEHYEYYPKPIFAIPGITTA